MQHLSRSAIALTLAIAPGTFVFAHGSMLNPISRIYSGFLEGPQNPESAAVQAAIKVGGTQPFYDWNEVVNFVPGPAEAQENANYTLLIPDGTLASGNNPKYAGLDLVRDDWPSTPISAGPMELEWFATTPHDPSLFRAWITTPDWDPLQPLTWSKMAPLPLGPVKLVDGVYRFTTLIPQRTGKHCIYVIWQRIDPAGEGFYSVSDVDFGDGPATTCASDFDSDGAVDGADLAHLLAAWGTSDADLTGDGSTDGADLAELLAAWGACGNDCNGDGISDAAEIAAGAPDCDLNGVPDTCQADEDCDGDGVLDFCAIVYGLAEDCDVNFVPDTCDIAAGGDADGDGHLDACQIDGLTWSWQVASDWGTGFVASLTIENGSSRMINQWSLTFDTPGYTIDSLWDGVLVSQEEGVATVKNAPWNHHLPPGASVTIGFQATGAPTAPSEVVMNSSVVEPAP